MQTEDEPKNLTPEDKIKSLLADPRSWVEAHLARSPEETWLAGFRNLVGVATNWLGVLEQRGHNPELARRLREKLELTKQLSQEVAAKYPDSQLPEDVKEQLLASLDQIKKVL